MRSGTSLSLALLLATAVSCAENPSFNVVDFGARPSVTACADSSVIANNTTAFQKAIDTAAVCQGRVVVPEGVFTCGALYLKSHIELHLQNGAVLMASPDSADYSPADVCPQSHPSKADKASGRHFIVCNKETDVSITGAGCINGNSTVFTVAPGGGPYMSKAEIPWRPSQMLFFANCSNIRIEGIELADSPYWNCFFYGCDNISISSLNIHSRRNPVSYNGDGLDFDCCNRVNVRDCNINTSDDCIAIRADGRYLEGKQDCSDIDIRDCRLSSLTSAIRLGVGSGTISRIRACNIDVKDTRSVFTIVSGWSSKTDGVNVRDVVFRNFTVKNSVQLFLIYPKVARHDRYVRDVTFENISARVELPGLLFGYEDAPYENISFRNVDCNTGLDVRYAGVKVSGGTLKLLSLSEEERAQVWDDYNRRKLEVRYNGFSEQPGL